MSDTDATDPTTASSMANAAQNAAAYPATAGDVDRSTGLAPADSGDTSGDERPTVDTSAPDLVAWIEADGIDDDERGARADHAEQLEAQRPGDNRRSVTSAIRKARD